VARTRANGQGREAAARGEEQARGDAEALLLVAQLTGGNDPGPKQLADWMRKHAAAPDGFIVTCRKYLKKAGNQIAQFDAALKRDEHLQTQKEHDRKGNRPEVCDDCGQSNGRHAVDCLVLRGAA
jgi:hypothetical protein